ncbi:metal ABC transporter substrate-binding protein [Candidatus Woesearchaeota archaeon]|nr:metal ABC transporter substrate-binding protein [Candidatus Woesearchaeota archaeon]
MGKNLILFFLMLLFISLIGCTQVEQQIDDDNIKILSTNYPLNYFAKRISGNDNINFFPSMDGDPAFWEPSPEDITNMQESDIILINGASYEKWLTSVSLPQRKIIDTSNVFESQLIVMEESVDHAHGPSGDHSHSGTAFTKWLDFNQAAFQAKAIKDVMIKQNIGDEKDLNENFQNLVNDLEELDTRIHEIADGNSEVALLASHPVYQYFARRYNLNIEAVMWEPDSFPEPNQWEELYDLVKIHPAKYMIWEGEPLQESINKLEEMGIKSIVFDPLGNRPDEGDFMDGMNQNVDNLEEIFK